MRLQALISYTPMGMPEAHRLPVARQSMLAHASEVAQWVVLLLGWLWLGEQGMRLGWSLASGVLAVALWWMTRLVFRGRDWLARCPPGLVGLCGLLTAGSVHLPSQWQGQGAAHITLLAVALLWGVWSAMVESRGQPRSVEFGRLAWHPPVACAGVILVWRMPGGEHLASGGVSVLLLLCAAVLFVRDLRTATHADGRHSRPPEFQTLLAPSAMGVMMGSLWAGNGWCDGLGWTTDQAAMAHLLVMAGLPTLVAWFLCWPGWRRISPLSQTWLSLVLLAFGALLSLGNGAVLAMLLLSLAWALHRCSLSVQIGAAEVQAPWLACSTALLLGPVLLVWVGATSEFLGPAAMQSALALQGVLAAWQAGRLWRHRRLPTLPLSAT